MRSPRRKSNPSPHGVMPPRAGAHVHLPEEVVADILSRLPGKSVLRFRAVCTAWRRITTDPHFLAAHARRRPLELVLCTLLERRPWTGDQDGDGYSNDLAFDSIPVAAADSADQRRLIRYPDYVIKTPRGTRYIGFGNLLITSCAGVFLFKNNGRYLICNPVTRQWAELQQLPRGYFYECGLYFHQPSGEYRLLCRLFKFHGMHEYYITSTATGATTPRHVSVDEAADKVVWKVHHMMNVALQDRLHWMLSFSENGDSKIVAFDTSSEMFHLMPAPPMSCKHVKLFDMNGKLAAANFGETHINLWFLKDYGAGEWAHRHQIVIPPMLKELGDPKGKERSYNSRITVASDDEENVILGKTGYLMVYNVRTKTTRGVDFIHESQHGSDERHFFRESLIMPHDVRPSAGHPMVQFG